MSWSNRWIGRPSVVSQAIDRYSEVLSGNSKEEFDAVRPALKQAVEANSDEAVIELDANGHAYTSGERRVAAFQMHLRNIGTLLL